MIFIKYFILIFIIANHRITCGDLLYLLGLVWHIKFYIQHHLSRLNGLQIILSNYLLLLGTFFVSVIVVLSCSFEPYSFAV